MALSPGGMLLHYRLVEKIGEGGMERWLGRWFVNGAVAVWEPSVLRACQ